MYVSGKIDLGICEAKFQHREKTKQLLRVVASEMRIPDNQYWVSHTCKFVTKDVRNECQSRISENRQRQPERMQRKKKN